MQQMFRTLATLVMGALMAAGGYAAAIVVPHLQAASRDGLPPTANLFGSPASESLPPQNATAETTGPGGLASAVSSEAADWFGGFAETATVPDASPNSQVSELGEPNLGSPAASPFAKFEAALTENTSAAAASMTQSAKDRVGGVVEAFGASVIPSQVRTAADDAFGDAAAMSTEATERDAASREAGTGELSMSGTDAWRAAVQDLERVQPLDYRLSPTRDDRVRCDVWMAEPGGVSVRRCYSGYGDSPSNAVADAVRAIRATR